MVTGSQTKFPLPIQPVISTTVCHMGHVFWLCLLQQHLVGPMFWPPNNLHAALKVWSDGVHFCSSTLLL